MFIYHFKAFALRDGKCELGWTLIDDTCYTYVGAYLTYEEATRSCSVLEARMARETTAPLRLPRFRRLAKQSQYNYEAQSFRRMWLYTEPSVSVADNSVCEVIEDYGVAYASCGGEVMPFICEKDPAFLGVTLRFKDESKFWSLAELCLVDV